MRWFMVIFVMVGIIGGCTAVPQGPTVQVLPGRAHSFAEFQRSDVSCRQYATTQQQETPEGLQAQAAVRSALLAGALGAGLGAGIGAATGSPGKGAAIGAASGTAVGTAGGLTASQRALAQWQAVYDTAYTQCMYAEGHQIPALPTMSR
jgi:hypothetical protein